MKNLKSFLLLLGLGFAFSANVALSESKDVTTDFMQTQNVDSCLSGCGSCNIDQLKDEGQNSEFDLDNIDFSKIDLSDFDMSDFDMSEDSEDDEEFDDEGEFDQLDSSVMGDIN